MRFTVDHQQRKFFHTNGYITLEELISQEDVNTLYRLIQKEVRRRNENNIFEIKDLYCSIHEILKILKKRQLGEIVFELTGQKPLRIATDRYFTPPVQLPFANLPDWTGFAGDLWGVFLSLKGDEAGHGICFDGERCQNLSIQQDQTYLLIVFTKNYLDKKHPIVYS